MKTAFTLLVALAAVPAVAEVEVRAANGRVDVHATNSPVADILERLSRQTGMKVVYEGAPPRQLVTATLEGRTPAEAVLGVLEGLGLNYAMVMDPTGTNVQTLLMTGAAGPGMPLPGPGSAMGRPPGIEPRPRVQPPVEAEPEPEPDQPEEEATEGEEAAPAEGKPGGQEPREQTPPGGQPATPNPQPGAPAGPTTPPGLPSSLFQQPPAFVPTVPPGTTPPTPKPDNPNPKLPSEQGVEQ